MVDNSETVVLVEDDFILENNVKSAIEKEDIPVKTVKRDANLLKNLMKIKPAIVILDIDKDEDDEDDFETIFSIREEEKLKDTEVFVYSEELQVKAEVALRTVKISSFYTKNGPVEHLVRGINYHFSRDEIYNDYNPWEDSASEDEEEKPVDDVLSVEEATAKREAEDFNKMLTDLHTELDNKVSGTDEGPEIYYNLGVSYMEMDMLEMAAEQFGKCSLDPEWRFKSLNMLSLVYKKEGSYDKAIDTLKECYKIAPDDYAKLGCRYDIADSYVLMGRMEEAYKMFATVYKADPKFKDTRERLRDIKIEMKKSGKS